MKMLTLLTLVLACTGWAATAGEDPDDGWIPLFDGKSLDGWKATEKTSSFSVRDGMICAESGRSHLFYVGPVAQHDFRDFEFKAEVKTASGSNSGIYFHTAYQETGWPRTGYEAQVNNSHKDPVRTGSIYHVQDLRGALVKDDEWFTYQITVRGKTITISLNGREVNEFSEPPNAKSPPGWSRRLDHGTFALQAHDPKSKVYYRRIMVKPLGD